MQKVLTRISDLMEYEPDANMLFNYLMVSALANVTERVEREGGRNATGGMVASD